jgi:hypothetical protein
MSGKSIVLVAVLGGCASTRVALEKPIAGRCESSGLSACSEITEGVIMYVEGDQRLAYQKLHVAASLSEPEDVMAFAAALKTVNREPGASKHGAALDELSDLLSREAKVAATQSEAEVTNPSPPKRRKSATAAAKSTNVKPDTDDGVTIEPVAMLAAAESISKKTLPPAPAVAQPIPAGQMVPLAQVEGRTVVPAIDEGNRACVLNGIMSPSAQSSRGYCVRAVKGPIVVTDLHSSTACPAELFAISVVPGDLSTPRWAVYGPPGNAINVSGGALLVRENEQFVIGVMSGSDQKMKRDIRCAVTWSGYRAGAMSEAE